MPDSKIRSPRTRLSIRTPFLIDRWLKSIPKVSAADSVARKTKPNQNKRKSTNPIEFPSSSIDRGRRSIAGHWFFFHFLLFHGNQTSSSKSIPFDSFRLIVVPFRALLFFFVLQVRFDFDSFLFFNQFDFWLFDRRTKTTPRHQTATPKIFTYNLK